MFIDKIIETINKISYFENQNIKNNSPAFEIPRRALIVLPNYIGDTVILTPTLRNLRYNLGKNVRIDYAGNESSYNLIETLPYYNNFYIKKKEIKNKGLFLKKNCYDTVFLFDFQFLWALVGYHTGINQRISFNLEKVGLNSVAGWQNLFTHYIKCVHIKDKKPQLKVYLDVLKSLGLSVFDDYTEIRLTNKDLDIAENLLKIIPEPRICIHITAGSPGKQWNINNWIAVLKHLTAKYNCVFVSIGTLKEKHLYDYLSMKSGTNIINLCGKTTIRETIALFRHFDLVITLDTAPAHLAAAANTKNIIIIYGPTNESQWIPSTQSSNIIQIYLDLSCRPCLVRLCREKKCLTMIGPEIVINAIDRVFK